MRKPLHANPKNVNMNYETGEVIDYFVTCKARVIYISKNSSLSNEKVFLNIFSQKFKYGILI